MGLILKASAHYKTLMEVEKYSNYTNRWDERFYRLATENHIWAQNRLPDPDWIEDDAITLPVWHKIRTDLVIKVKEDIRRGLYTRDYANRNGYSELLRKPEPWLPYLRPENEADTSNVNPDGGSKVPKVPEQPEEPSDDDNMDDPDPWDDPGDGSNSASQAQKEKEDEDKDEDDDDDDDPEDDPEDDPQDRQEDKQEDSGS